MARTTKNTSKTNEKNSEITELKTAQNVSELELSELKAQLQKMQEQINDQAYKLGQAQSQLSQKDYEINQLKSELSDKKFAEEKRDQVVSFRITKSAKDFITNYARQNDYKSIAILLSDYVCNGARNTTAFHAMCINALQNYTGAENFELNDLKNKEKF